MSTLTVTVAGSAIDYGEVELTRGTSDALPAPEAEVTGAVGEFTAADSVTIATDTETLFTGQVARPRIRQGGRRDLTCEHDLAPLFEESVDVPPTTSVTTALESAVTNASTPATVQFEGGDVTLGEQYAAEGRSVRRIFSDLTERTGRVWRINDPDTIVVEPLGANGTISVDTMTADAAVQQFDPGDARTVINDVTVNGTGGERVVGTASDATSISEYGTRSNGGTNVNYIETQSEANDYADALLRPDPLASAAVVVGARSLNVVEQQANATLTLTDPSRGIDGVELVVEEQTNTSGGSAVLKAGEGAASSLVTENRQNRSRDDVTEPGSVYDTDRIADDAINSDKLGPESVTAAELADNAVEEDKIFPQAVVEGALADDAVARAKVQTSAINAARLADSAVETDKIAQAAIDGDKIQTGAVGTTKLFVADWIPVGLSFTDDDPFSGDVSWNDHQLVYEGTTYDISAGDTDATYIYWFEGDGFYQASDFKPNLGPDDALVCINDGGEANQILQATSIHGGSIVTNSIEATEIRTGTLTADEIDVLDLDTDQLTVGDELDGGWEFGTESFSGSTIATMEPFGDGALIGRDSTSARPDAYLSELNVDNITMDDFISSILPSDDDQAEVGSSSRAFSEMNAYEFIDAGTGTAINDGGDPLAGLADGHGPPDTCERCDDETGETRGYSVNQMAREAWDVIREQTRRIEALEARLAALEDEN